MAARLLTLEQENSKVIVPSCWWTLNLWWLGQVFSSKNEPRKNGKVRFRRAWHTENNTWGRVDMDFFLLCSTRYPTRSQRTLVTYRVEDENRNSIPSSYQDGKMVFEVPWLHSVFTLDVISNRKNAGINLTTWEILKIRDLEANTQF